MFHFYSQQCLQTKEFAEDVTHQIKNVMDLLSRSDPAIIPRWFLAVNKHGPIIQCTLWTSGARTTYVVYVNFFKMKNNLRTDAATVIADTKRFLKSIGVDIEAVIQDIEFLVNGSCLTIKCLSNALVNMLQSTDVRNVNQLPYRMIFSHEVFLEATRGSEFDQLATKNRNSVLPRQRKKPSTFFDPSIFHQDIEMEITENIRNIMGNDIMSYVIHLVFGICRELNADGNVDPTTIVEVSLALLISFFKVITSAFYSSMLANFSC